MTPTSIQQEAKEKAAINYAETNYQRAPLQDLHDAGYIQSVSYHSFLGGAAFACAIHPGREGTGERETHYFRFNR